MKNLRFVSIGLALVPLHLTCCKPADSRPSGDASAEVSPPSQASDASSHPPGARHEQDGGFQLQGVFEAHLSRSGVKEPAGVWIFHPSGEIQHYQFATSTDVILESGAFDLKQNAASRKYEIAVRKGYHSGSSEITLLGSTEAQQPEGFSFNGENGLVELRFISHDRFSSLTAPISSVTDFRLDKTREWRKPPDFPNRLGPPSSS